MNACESKESPSMFAFLARRFKRFSRVASERLCFVSPHSCCGYKLHLLAVLSFLIFSFDRLFESYLSNFLSLVALTNSELCIALDLEDPMPVSKYFEHFSTCQVGADRAHLEPLS